MRRRGPGTFYGAGTHLLHGHKKILVQPNKYPISIFSFLGISLCFIQTINIAKDNNSSHYQSSVGPGGIFMFIALTLICVYVFSVSDHD